MIKKEHLNYIGLKSIIDISFKINYVNKKWQKEDLLKIIEKRYLKNK
jgi:hypothetical protein